MPCDPATSDPAVSGVLLGDVEDWASGVPLGVAVKRIDPNGSNPYVQANADGFRAGSGSDYRQGVRNRGVVARQAAKLF